MKITNATLDPAGTVLLTNTSGDPTNKTGKLRLNVFLDGGDAFLFKFNTGTPFVGVPEPTSAALAGIAALAFWPTESRGQIGHSTSCDPVRSLVQLRRNLRIGHFRTFSDICSAPVACTERS